MSHITGNKNVYGGDVETEGSSLSQQDDDKLTGLYQSVTAHRFNLGVKVKSVLLYTANSQIKFASMDLGL